MALSALALEMKLLIELAMLLGITGLRCHVRRREDFEPHFDVKSTLNN